MVKVFLSKVIVMSILVCSMAFASCTSDVPTATNEEETENPQQPGDTEGSVSTVKFSLDFNSLSRANIPVDLGKYDVRVYVYQAVSTAEHTLTGWNKWSGYSDLSLKEWHPYVGEPIEIKLNEPELHILFGYAKRYSYNIITVASTKGTYALPNVTKDKNLSRQFTENLPESGVESVEIFKSNIEILPTGESDSDKKPQTGGKLNIEELTGDGEYNAETKNIKAVLKRKSGEVQVTVMKNASEKIITNLLEADTIDVTISGAASAIGFEPLTSPMYDDKTGRSYDVNLDGTATIKKSFPVDFNKNNAEVLLLESLPRYRYNEGLDKSYKGIELKLEFKNENGKIINSISVAPEKQFYIFPNTRSTITLGESGFTFGNDINLDDDSWDGIH